MITITLLAPYRAVQAEIEDALRSYDPPEPIRTSVYAMEVEEAAGATFHADVIIARGFTAAALRARQPGQLVVPLQTSAYDVIDAVSSAISQYGARRVALVGLPGMASMDERSSRIFDAEIRSFPAPGAASLPEVIRAAAAEGCDCFVGGLSLVKACERLNQPAVLLRTGRPAIIGSLEEAIRLVQSTREQRERSLFFRTILDHSKEGVIAIDRDGRIASINAAAARSLDLDPDRCLSRPAEGFLPFFAQIEATLAGGAPVENDIHVHGGRMLAVDCVPMRRDGDVAGGVVFLRSVDRLQNEESIIRQKIQARGQKARYHFADIVRRSDAVAAVIDKARLFARVDSPVLIAGESGTGKELFAQSIHNASRRAAGPFVAVNCAALTESLLESELFGYSDGAFTGALRGGKEGLFEAAHGGTLFLDEISEIPLSFQSKLLRVLQENEVRRLGSHRVIAVDTRIIAATNVDLLALVERAQFRQDLLFRLNVLHLAIPPLRDRPGDIAELFTRYVREFSGRAGRQVAVITSDAWQMLEAHRWRGNVRELRNIAERVCVCSRGDVIDAAAVQEALHDGLTPSALPPPVASSGAADEREHLRRLLRLHAGNRGKVALELGCNRSTVWRKMKRYGLLDHGDAG
ncbi:MAG: sigma 54-interacting transcriptional regulator [Planctomycetes bacterium]|nr:sigma 54-interacting transcriptional regulator [Planctomycetota bacterium]